MWIGVTRGLASEKFSASMVVIGKLVTSRSITVIVTITGVESFLEKNGWNLDFSILEFVPIGDVDPVL